MDKYSILATGQSVTQKLADSLEGKSLIVVSDAFRLAPWADILVSQDAAWWRANRDAAYFAGLKYSSGGFAGGRRVPGGDRSWSSGLTALHVAVLHGATEIEIYGYDMHGTHFFGNHQPPLTNTTEEQFEMFQRQFQQWKNSHPNVSVINRTPNSELLAYPWEE